MEQYFEDVVKNLDSEDVNVLSTLFSNEATSSIKSMKTKDVQTKVGYTESVYRKVIYRLCASQLIKSTRLNKQQKIFITYYGIKAINESIQEKVETISVRIGSNVFTNHQ